MMLVNIVDILKFSMKLFDNILCENSGKQEFFGKYVPRQLQSTNSNSNLNIIACPCLTPLIDYITAHLYIRKRPFFSIPSIVVLVTQSLVELGLISTVPRNKKFKVLQNTRNSTSYPTWFFMNIKNYFEDIQIIYFHGSGKQGYSKWMT